MFKEPSKTCPKCTKALPLYKFAKNRCAKDGLQVYCRPCFKLIRKAGKLRKPPANKTCSDCKQTFPNTEFWKNKSQRDGLQNYCKSCNKARNDRYRSQPDVKDRNALTQWVWRQDNIERCREASRIRCKRYRERHPDRVKAALKAYRVRCKQRWLKELLVKSSKPVANYSTLGLYR